jgi:hypothetical protein
MNLQEWRAKQQLGETFTLPSGLEVRLRKIGLLDLAAQGKIPTTLAPRINEMMKNNGMISSDLEQLVQFVELLNIVCTACLVSPDGLDVAELPYEDKLAIFNWASAMSAKLSPFRSEQAEFMAA